jgi:DNA-binding XRE family transcriptional regulator
MSLRNRIKVLVDDLGVTPYKFAQEVGIAYNTAYRLYNKPEKLPDISVVQKICDTYQVQVDKVVYWQPDNDAA